MKPKPTLILGSEQRNHDPEFKIRSGVSSPPSGHNENRSMTYCSDRIVVHTSGNVKVAATLKCRSWNCPDCSERRQAQLIAEAIGGSPQRFITLTSRRVENKTATEAAQELVTAWRIIRRKITQGTNAKQCEFIAVFEATKLGWPHLHILQRGSYIDQRFISLEMNRLTNSPVVDIRIIKNASQIAGYVAKYIGKNPHKFGKLKRYWKSKKYDLRPKKEQEKKGTCEVLHTFMTTWCSELLKCGYQVTRIDNDHAIAVKRLE